MMSGSFVVPLYLSWSWRSVVLRGKFRYAVPSPVPHSQIYSSTAENLRGGRLLRRKPPLSTILSEVYVKKKESNVPGYPGVDVEYVHDRLAPITKRTRDTALH